MERGFVKNAQKKREKEGCGPRKKVTELQYFWKGLIWAQSIHFSQKGMFSKFEFFFIGSCKMCASGV